MMACRTAVSTFLSDGNLTHPFFATIYLSTQTLNSPQSPSINSGCTPNSRLINSATRAALGLYDAQISQNRMRTGGLDLAFVLLVLVVEHLNLHPTINLTAKDKTPTEVSEQTLKTQRSAKG